MLFYDTESCFLRKGYKRKDTQLFEIGMVYGRKTFQCMVNPVGDKPPMRTLESLGQHPAKPIRFWTKLLSEKGYLNTAVRRLPPEEQSQRIAKVIRHEDFLTPEDAIRRAHAFGKGKLWIAHNGKSFDEKIICGHLKRFQIVHNIQFEDSLHILRKLIDLPSYSQPKVYKALFKTTYKAHHALEDARALQRICKRAGGVAFLTPLLGSILDSVAPRIEAKKAPLRPKAIERLPAPPLMRPTPSLPLPRPQFAKVLKAIRSCPSNHLTTLA